MSYSVELNSYCSNKAVFWGQNWWWRTSVTYKKLHKSDVTLNQNLRNMLKSELGETLKRLTVQVNIYIVSLLFFRGGPAWCTTTRASKTLMGNVRKTFKRLKKHVRKKVKLFVLDNTHASPRSNELSPITDYDSVVRTREEWIYSWVAKLRAESWSRA